MNISAPWKIRLRLLAALVVFLPLSASALYGQEQHHEGDFEPFFFVVMADPQLGWAARDASFEIEERNFRQAIQAANRLKPAFVVICGDLVNKPGDPAQIAAFKRLMGEFSGEFPIHLVSGNHDVTGAPTPESLAAYRGTFGPDRYTFDHAGTRFLVLNSTILVSGAHVGEEVAAQEQWLRAELARARQDGVRDLFVAQHHPWFWQSPEEPYRPLNSIRPEIRAPYLELFRDHGVLAVFAGHVHRNQLGRDGAMEMICTASITPPSSGEPAGLRVVRVYGDSIEHEYFALDAVPDHIALDQPAPAP